MTGRPPHASFWFVKFVRYTIPAPEGADLAGASVAHAHRRELDQALGRSDPNDALVVVLDFSPVRAATASYLKGMWLSLVVAGRQWFERADTVQPDGPPSRDLYPVLTGLDDELREEVGVLARAEKVCAVVSEKNPDRDTLERVVLLGDLEASAQRTIEALAPHAEASAVQLHASQPSRVSATAWNNRLNELCRLRVATRRREGRQMKYSLIANEVTYG